MILDDESEGQRIQVANSQSAFLDVEMLQGYLDVSRFLAPFRIDEEVISIVEQESQRLNINLNKMANQILKSYVKWDMLQARAGMIPIAKPLLIELQKGK